MTNYEMIVNEIVQDKERLAMYLAYIDSANDWPITAKNWRKWLDTETEFNLDKLDSDVESYMK